MISTNDYFGTGKAGKEFQILANLSALSSPGKVACNEQNIVFTDICSTSIQKLCRVINPFITKPSHVTVRTLET
jgi:hypothetical protein